MIHKLFMNILWLLVKILYLTYRFEMKNKPAFLEAKKLSSSGAILFCCWHEHAMGCLLSFFHFAFPQSLVMASRSKDGDYAAFVATRCNMIPVRGSSRKKGKDKGGKEAMSEFVEKIKATGVSGSITVDGPKGPRRNCKNGILQIALETGIPILPTAFITKNIYVFNSWDQFKFPLPFSKIEFILGEPITVKSANELEEKKALLTKTLNSLAP